MNRNEGDSLKPTEDDDCDGDNDDNNYNHDNDCCTNSGHMIDDTYCRFDSGGGANTNQVKKFEVRFIRLGMCPKVTSIDVYHPRL